MARATNPSRTIQFVFDDVHESICRVLNPKIKDQKFWAEQMKHGFDSIQYLNDSAWQIQRKMESILKGFQKLNPPKSELGFDWMDLILNSLGVESTWQNQPSIELSRIHASIVPPKISNLLFLDSVPGKWIHVLQLLIYRR